MKACKPVKPLPEVDRKQPRKATLLRKDFSSGRSVVLKQNQNQERLEIRSPEGQTEVEIEFTAAGPVVRVRCGSLEFGELKKFAIRCEEFDLETTQSAKMSFAEGLELSTERQLKIRSAGDTRINAERILLNCSEI